MSNLSYYNVLKELEKIDIDEYFKKVTLDDVKRSIYKCKGTEEDYLNLISPIAQELIEEMAQKSQQLTLQHFGKTILLFTPIYLANYCTNKCAYCGYNVENKIRRKKLTSEEIEEEAKAISSMGFKHILALTGESPTHSPVSYIRDSVKVLRKYFDSVGVEIYALTEEEYKELVDAGVDNFTMFQELYNEEIYDRVHLGGPKKNFRFRLDAPERAAKAGMRTINMGALLGLNDFRKESFFTAMHGKYIQDNYSDVNIAFSFPRIRPHSGSFTDILPVTDIDLVQAILALRIFFPTGGITISTRETEEFRNNLIPLGVTKMSAASSTEVGAHTQEDTGEAQFEISDDRTVEQVKKAICNKGYQPIFKDWFKI